MLQRRHCGWPCKHRWSSRRRHPDRGAGIRSQAPKHGTAAAPAPEDEPPLTRSQFHGLRTAS